MDVIQKPRKIEISLLDEATTKEASCLSRDSKNIKYSWSERLKYELRNSFGLYEFREQQEDVINCTMSNKDCFVLMPTGGGKSLCYQLPAVISPGVTIVVSPLVSLIHDQVTQLKNLGISANYLGAGSTDEQQVYNDLLNEDGTIKLLYITPEKLTSSNKLQNILQTLHHSGRRISRVAIDEAHCVSQWGRDFRPSYKNCSLFKKLFPDVPIIALTATATEEVRNDTIKQLSLTTIEHFQTSFNRPNLRYEVKEKEKDLDSICNWIKKTYNNKSGIIYCLSRNECEKVSEILSSNNIRANFYHASLPDAERESRQQQWYRGAFHVMVATIAFGMGINKSNVRFVIHFTVPKSIEAFYQESGRAGRDGLVAHAIILFKYSDAQRVERLVTCTTNSYTKKSNTIKLKERVDSIVQYCQDKETCRRVLIMKYLGENFTTSECNNTCDNCCSPYVYEKKECTALAHSLLNCIKSMRRATMRMIINVWRGSNSCEVRKLGYEKLPEFGKGSVLAKDDADSLIQSLVRTGQLCEETVVFHFHGNSCTYVKIGTEVLPDEYFFNIRKFNPRARENVNKASLQRDKLVQLLLKDLQVVQLEQVGDGIEQSACVDLIKLMTLSLPTSPVDLLEEQYTDICPVPLIHRYGRKFTEAINKFIQENPEIKNIPLNAVPSQSLQLKDVKVLKRNFVAPGRSTKTFRNQTNVVVSNWPPRKVKTTPALSKAPKSLPNELQAVCFKKPSQKLTNKAKAKLAKKLI